MKLYPFIYGRSRSIDYRWIVRPKLALLESFFAKTLEKNSTKLRGNSRLYFIRSDSDAQVISVFFNDIESVDERGRAIGFAIGATVNREYARDFNYFLPQILENFNKFFDPIIDELRQSTLKDSLPSIADFDINQLIGGSTSKEKLSRTYDFNFATDYKLKSVDTESENPQQSNKDADWILEVSTQLKSMLVTPPTIANFEYMGCGQLLDTSFAHQNREGHSYTSNILDADSQPPERDNVEDSPLAQLREMKAQPAPLRQADSLGYSKKSNTNLDSTSITDEAKIKLSPNPAPKGLLGRFLSMDLLGSSAKKGRDNDTT